MAKIIKQKYYNKDGTSKVNCYHITITKFILEAAGIKDDDDVIVYAKDGKIIIEKNT